MPGEPNGEWEPDSDEEPEGFLGASFVFWDMKRVEVLSQKKHRISAKRACDKKSSRRHTRQGRGKKGLASNQDPRKKDTSPTVSGVKI